MKYLLLFFIRSYQRIPRSFFLIAGGSCRFTPVCSQYCYEAINTHGTIRGIVLCVKRVLKCNPL